MRGVVAAGHPLTAEAGAAVLREGGNAVDAAVAAVLMSFAAESPLTGPGAGGFMLVHTASGENHLLDFFVAAPGKGLGSRQPAALKPIDVHFTEEAIQVFNIGPSSCGVYGTTKGLAEALGIPTVTLPIHDAYEVMLKILDPVFAGTEPGLAEENLQSRIRGNLLMAISNKTGRLVLSTGNKSEMSTGYATLYGDMAGGFAVLKDVPKTLVYDLSRWRNRDSEVIPQEVIDRPPTAELRANQLDSDSLPPYEVLDPILQAYVEGDRSPEEIVADGFPAGVVRRVVEMVDRAEYKRRQAPPGVKITRRAFGRDRRPPITNRYRPHF